MTEPAKIKITLKPGEGIKVEAMNFTGSSCLKATEALLKMGESNTEMKPEFYEPDVETSTSVDVGL
ncbi:MAG TPA: hypothetical protein DCE56_24475 [Cyanobacteria bacterium UBA8553]|jgi:hypothetical protein|nr:hypothetical protein [Cyanobacteria bacterium UBA8553]HAJ58941.1 hypothetical protein [Cyanobacteria bacterium UBA8543]